MNYKKFTFLTISLLFGALLFSESSFAQYQVSGIVEFSYRDYETKIGNDKTSSSSFTQYYRANLTNYIFDPRFLQLTAGVGYNVTSSKGGDNSTLDYDIVASFFPGQKIQGSAYWRKADTTIQSNSNIAGYDINTTSYGANLIARLSLFSRRNGRGSNDNVNNNANSEGGSFIYPDIVLTYGHVDSESLNSAFSSRESRDNILAGLRFSNR